MMQINVADRGNVPWYVGRPAPALSQPEVRAVLSVYADGHEFQHCMAKFAGLPCITGANHAQWFGDMAKFIVANL